MVALGAASAAVAGAVGTLAQGLLGLALSEGTVAWHAARCVLCVALVEELCKLLAARRVSERCRMGTMLCCVLAAIGFDLAENLIYSIAATMAVTVVRALKSVAGHTLYGAIMGLALGRAEPPQGPRRTARRPPGMVARTLSQDGIRTRHATHTGARHHEGTSHGDRL